jgi:hypothetical protein
VSDIFSQLRAEWIHLASLGIFGGIAYLIKRDLRRGDSRLEEIERRQSAILDKLDSHARQIRDTRAAVGCCETALKVQHYPYVD